MGMLDQPVGKVVDDDEDDIGRRVARFESVIEIATDHSLAMDR